MRSSSDGVFTSAAHGRGSILPPQARNFFVRLRFGVSSAKGMHEVRTKAGIMLDVMPKLDRGSCDAWTPSDAIFHHLVMLCSIT